MINKITLLLTIGLVCLGLSAFSQTPAFRINPSNSTLDIGDTLEVEITVEDFNNVVGFSFSLNWDPNILTYDNSVDTVLFQLPPTPSFGDNNASAGNLTFLWTRFPPIPTNLADGTTVITIARFVATGAGTTALDLNNMPTDDLVIVEPGLELDPILFDGSVTVNGGGGGNPGGSGFDCSPFTDFTAAVESDSASTGEVLCLTTFVCNWTQVVNAQWSYNWNPAILQFDSITNINPNVPLLTPGDFNANNNTGFGVLAYADTTDTAGGSTIPDSSLFDVCFTVIGAGGEMDTVNISGDPLPIEVTTVSSMGTPITVNTQEGFVTVSGTEAPAATISASTQNAEAGELSCVPITVQNFTNIVAFQYTLEFDTSLLVYNSIQNVNPNVNGLAGSVNDAPNFVDNGKLLTAWSAFPVVPVTLANSDTLYEVCFDVKADATPGETALITFSDDPLARGATQDNGSGDVPITLLSSDGEIDIIGSGFFEMTINDAEVCPDSSICMPLIVDDGFNAILSFQWIHTYDTGIFTFDGVENVNPAFIFFGASEIAAFETTPGSIR
ncbi:MAG: cohesin domain-containing protein, partial [Bacteroidota bacterium]